ncbi:GNAT family N-acetyltransferase [Congzhengia minquanensis]|uniref:GNAT family N-acetyltransferase n=2 Tax=Congzhengia TaxID=2944150 RepID=A0A926DPR2_9FIRM|nr:GNAT family N-acetyltransferase [Congzhengia minquanensis]MBC8541094.1 GNAT family N-acetyltransferase [Congzhengia minquanensis]
MFEVRRATLEDVDSIVKITQEAFEKYIKLADIKDTPALHETREQVIKDIDTKIVYVAYINNQVVGSMRIELIDKETAYLSRFGVNTEFQNLGIGKSMMNSLDMELAELKVKRVMLHTASKATSLVRFYYNRGFYIDSTTKDKGYIRALLIKDLA